MIRSRSHVAPGEHAAVTEAALVQGELGQGGRSSRFPLARKGRPIGGGGLSFGPRHYLQNKSRKEATGLSRARGAIERREWKSKTTSLKNVLPSRGAKIQGGPVGFRTAGIDTRRDGTSTKGGKS